MTQEIEANKVSEKFIVSVRKILFITDKKNIDFKVPGGVQICTEEFLEYLRLSGFEVIPFYIVPTKDILKRLKIKLDIEVYERYNFDVYINDIAYIINNENINLVAINQLNLSMIVGKLKSLVSDDVKFIALSHGNESGDYLHDITKDNKPTFAKIWKLGKQIIYESYFFKNLFDAVIVISEHETSINQWLGALNIFYLPRLLSPKFIVLKPISYRIGFVGTLDHLPNNKGLEMVAKALQEKGFNGKIRLVGAPEIAGKAFEEKYPFIEYLGKLENEQLINEVASWSLFLNPVFWYSRGSSTKLCQAINWGLPIISTPAGRRGYVLSDEGIVTNNHNPSIFVDSIIKALNSKEVLSRLETSSKKNAEEFDKRKYAENLNKFLTTLH